MLLITHFLKLSMCKDARFVRERPFLLQFHTYKTMSIRRAPRTLLEKADKL